jgi:hypothetical protein
MRRVMDFYMNVWFIPSIALILLYFVVNKVLRVSKKEVVAKKEVSSDSDKNKTD